MTVSYYLNWMGPSHMKWYRERGLTEYKARVARTQLVAEVKQVEVGDTYQIETITTNYCAGRIDIRDDSKEGYDGWDEYSVAPMHCEDWYALSDWLNDLETTEQWDYEMLISTFEGECLGREIRWWVEKKKS